MQTISIIGSGMIGGQVARLSVAAGYNVIISNSRAPETLSRQVAELGPLARAATAEDAASAGDLVVLAIPPFAYRQPPATKPQGKTVIDIITITPSATG